MPRTVALLLAAAAAAVLVACGEPAGLVGTVDSPLTVAQAVSEPTGQRIVVSGFLHAMPGEPAQLCAAVLESFPPQCGRPVLVLQGYEISSRTDLAESQGIRWVDASVTLSGVRTSGGLEIDSP